MAAAVLVAAGAILAAAPRTPGGGAVASASAPGKGPAGSPRSRMDSSVAAAAAGSPGSELRADGLRPRAGMVTVEVTASAAGASEIRDLGGKVSETGGGSIEARLPQSALKRLAATPGVTRVAALDPGVPELVTGDEVAASGAAEAQAAGLTGAGVRVMVLDAGFGGLDAAQAEGEVGPATEINFCPSFTGGGEHGTQVAQILHEMAPAAELYLVCANGTADLDQAVEYAQQNGIGIISRSIGIFNSSRGDGSGGFGTPDAVVNKAARYGILWVNSAGNYARSHWGGDWSEDEDGYLEWAPGDTTNSVTIANDDTQCVYLKWDAWPRTDVDLDLGLREVGSPIDSASSNDPQDGSGPPTERLCVENTGPTRSFDIVVHHYVPPGEKPGPVPRVDLFVPDAAKIEYAVPATSLNDLSGNPNVLATGAFCTATGTIQPYSSQGPSIAGGAKPDISASTPVTTNSQPSNGCSGGFSGTSATAPQVAGAAALFSQALQLSGPSLRAALESLASSRDLGARGRDDVFGAGLLTVDLTCRGQAINRLGTPGDDVLAGTLGRDVVQGLQGSDRLTGSHGPDVLCGGPGRDRLSGGDGRDVLIGGPGRDRLRGGKGRDKLRGGPGKDNTKG